MQIKDLLVVALATLTTALPTDAGANTVPTPVRRQDGLLVAKVLGESAQEIAFIQANGACTPLASAGTAIQWGVNTNALCSFYSDTGCSSAVNTGVNGNGLSPNQPDGSKRDREDNLTPFLGIQCIVMSGGTQPDPVESVFPSATPSEV
ncbi:hypothetical protein BDV95DRAFT_603227 [Massariosphaeria phaeospora]|uniref:Uncharacterized protein n=1 Tax=Massariosphaeria phaeospora TaxID=100035 RepID=A0A7C8MKS8_9PLEO|nr:hypothetical protein BDV95DRAFT_603227 [Massariosphaeria phaeospora]